MIPGGWELIAILAVLVVLFGAKKLPGAARSVGQSMRIFKAETRGLRTDDNDAPADRAAPLPTPQPSLPTPQPSLPTPQPSLPSPQPSLPPAATFADPSSPQPQRDVDTH